MTYKELYDAVIENLEYKGQLNKVKRLACLVYREGYQDRIMENKQDAVYLALELYDEMTGNFFDPTKEQFDEIVDSMM